MVIFAVILSPGAELVTGRENAVAAGDDPAGEDILDRAGGVDLAAQDGQLFSE